MKRYVSPSFFLQLLEQVDDLRLDRHVQRRHRLVADDELRLERERARDADPLALAARELVRIALGHVLEEAHLRQQLAERAARPRPVGDEAVHERRLRDDLAHGHPRIERRIGILEDHLDRAPVALDVLGAGAASRRARRTRCGRRFRARGAGACGPRSSCRSRTRRRAPASRRRGSRTTRRPPREASRGRRTERRGARRTGLESLHLRSGFAAASWAAPAASPRPRRARWPAGRAARARARAGRRSDVPARFPRARAASRRRPAPSRGSAARSGSRAAARAGWAEDPRWSRASLRAAGRVSAPSGAGRRYRDAAASRRRSLAVPCSARRAAYITFTRSA